MPNILRRYQNIENEFFELDQKNKKALMKLEFDKPSSIFDKNAALTLSKFSKLKLDNLTNILSIQVRRSSTILGMADTKSVICSPKDGRVIINIITITSNISA